VGASTTAAPSPSAKKCLPKKPIACSDPFAISTRPASTP
jgi:hypothetical protein